MALPVNLALTGMPSCDLPANSRFGAYFRLFSSWHGPRTALNCSLYSDRVTRDWPVALRVHAAQIETRFGRVDGPKPLEHGSTLPLALDTQ